MRAQKLLLVLDLEQTLCYSQPRSTVYSLLTKPLDSAFIARPGLESLLRFLFVQVVKQVEPAEAEGGRMESGQ